MFLDKSFEVASWYF